MTTFIHSAICITTGQYLLPKQVLHRVRVPPFSVSSILSFPGWPGSSVGIATGYGLDGPGIESRWGRDFPQLPGPALGPTRLLYNGYRVFLGVKSGRGVTVTPHPF